MLSSESRCSRSEQDSAYARQLNLKTAWIKAVGVFELRRWTESPKGQTPWEESSRRPLAGHDQTSSAVSSCSSSYLRRLRSRQ